MSTFYLLHQLQPLENFNLKVKALLRIAYAFGIEGGLQLQSGSRALIQAEL